MNKTFKYSFRYRPGKDDDILRLKELIDLENYTFSHFVSFALKNVYLNYEKEIIAEVNSSKVISKQGTEVSIYLSKEDVFLLNQCSAASNINKATLIRNALKSVINVTTSDKEYICTETSIDLKLLKYKTESITKIEANNKTSAENKDIVVEKNTEEKSVKEFFEESKTVKEIIKSNKVAGDDDPNEKLFDNLFFGSF